MAVPAELGSQIGSYGLGIEIWNDEAELVCFTSRAAVALAGCLCAFCCTHVKEVVLPAGLATLAVVSSGMEGFSPLPRSASTSGEVLRVSSGMKSASSLPTRSSSSSGETLGHFAGMENKSAQEAVEVRLGDLSLRSMKEDTSSSGSLQEIRLKLSGKSHRMTTRA